MSTKLILSKHEDVVELATKVGQDIGGIVNLHTEDKTSVVAAVNEVYAAVNAIEVAPGEPTALKSDLTPLATKAEVDSTYAKKTELTPLATKTAVAKDIGNLASLSTTNKASVVAAVNEVLNVVNTTFEDIDTSIGNIYTSVDSEYAKKTDLTSLATKSELTTQIADLIGGADADNDTLKEIADRVTALAQADKGLVSAVATQTFTEIQRQQARDNIGSVSEADVNTILEAQAGGDYVSVYLQAALASNT